MKYISAILLSVFLVSLADTAAGAKSKSRQETVVDDDSRDSRDGKSDSDRFGDMEDRW